MSVKFEDSNGTKDKMRIIKHLYLSPEDAHAVEQAMRALESHSGDMVAEARSLLDSLDTIAATIEAEMGTANYALEQADVLKYTPDGRAKGMLMQRLELTKILGRFLGLRPNLRPIEDLLMMIEVPLPRNCSPTLPMRRN
jgi:hypothetical protein